MRRLLRLLRHDRQIRFYALLFLLSGTASSAGMPLVPLYLTQEHGASLAQVSVMTVAGLLGAGVGLPIGRLSDRVRSRSAILCFLACWMATGWTLLAFTPNFAAAVTVYVIGLPFIGPINAQVFAGLSNLLRDRDDPNPATITSSLRGGYSVGYIAGPLVGTSMAVWWDLRFAFLVAAALYLALAILGWYARITNDHATAATDSGEKHTAGLRPLLPLLVFVTGVSLVFMGDMFRAIYLPIYVVETLGHSETMFGALVAAAAAAEIIAFPVIGVLADRFGMRRVILAALTTAIAGYAILASSTHVWQVWTFHMLHVVVFAVTISLGVTYAQQLAPGQTGFASSAFFSAQTVAKPLAGAMGAVTVGALGLPGLFWIPAALCAGCLLAFALLSPRVRKPESTLAAAR